MVGRVELDIPPPNTEIFDAFVWPPNKGTAEGDVAEVCTGLVGVLPVFGLVTATFSIVIEGVIVTLSLGGDSLTFETEIWFMLDICPNTI